MTYLETLTEAMTLLGQENNSIFLGQGVEAGGTTMMETFSGIPKDKLIEFPVAEDMQMGTAVGMSLEGLLPVCVYPRWDFLLLASNQLVLHLDRLSLYSVGGYKPKVIIRVAVPSPFPLYAGEQHDDDFTDAFRLMLRIVRISTLCEKNQIMPAYRNALQRDVSTLIVEYTRLYRET